MIATAFPSEGIDEIWFLLWHACWFSAALLGLISLILCFLPRNNRIKVLWIALAGGLLSMYPLLFSLHVYRIDYVAFEMDGTPASPPLISAMSFPLIPLGACLFAACAACGRHRGTVENT